MAVADALKAMNMFLLPNVSVPILGVVENMSWFTPAELPDNKYFLFGEGGGQKLAQLGGVELLGQIPIVMDVRSSGDDGSPVILNESSAVTTPLMGMTGMVLQSLEKRNSELDPTEIVKMQS